MIWCQFQQTFQVCRCPLCFIQLNQYLSTYQEDGCVVRSELQTVGQVCQSSLRIRSRHVSCCTFHECVEVVGLLLQHAIEIFNGRVGVAQRKIEAGTMSSGSGQIVPQRNELRIVRNGFLAAIQP